MFNGGARCACSLSVSFPALRNKVVPGPSHPAVRQFVLRSPSQGCGIDGVTLACLNYVIYIYVLWCIQCIHNVYMYIYVCIYTYIYIYMYAQVCVI